MSKKKDRKPEELSPEEALNKRVDAMLNPNLPDPPAPKPGGAPPLDIFKDAPPGVAKATRTTAKTAPEVSGKLLDKIDEKVGTDITSPTSHAKRAPIKPSKPAGHPQEQPPTAAPHPDSPKGDPLDDEATDQAVADIATKDADSVLALQDAIGRKASRLAGELADQDHRAARNKKWLWLVFFGVLILLFLLAAPLTPYTCRWPVGIRLSVTTDIFPSVCK